MRAHKALPAGPVADWIAAVNSADLAKLRACMDPDVVVNDELYERRGIEAVLVWAADRIVARFVRLRPESWTADRTLTSVVAELDGDFDKRGLPTPLLLRIYFAADGGRVLQIIILPNTADDSL